MNKKTSKAFVFSIFLDVKVLLILTSEYQHFISYVYSQIVDQVKNLILSQKNYFLFKFLQKQLFANIFQNRCF